MRFPNFATLLIGGALCTMLLLPLGASAQTTVPRDVGEQFDAAARGAGVEQREGDPRVIIVRMINVTLSVIGILLIGFLVYAGYLWMTAAGNEDQVEKAKTTIRNAVIGIAIVFAAYAISRFVITNLLRVGTNVM
ncbi:hypothetical protein HY634_00855 [Candidatus Uhrbacteria bacterium]|nr:hypothetical protein [Candidatus Uhrbacteria bacterium]